MVEVHCVDEDWGQMADRWSVAGALEDRLCRIGTLNMFAWDDKAQRKVPVVHPMDFGEGVEVELGEYDVKRRAFVQCRLRVLDIGIQVGADVPGDIQFADTDRSSRAVQVFGKKDVKKRPTFKWGFFSEK